MENIIFSFKIRLYTLKKIYIDIKYPSIPRILDVKKRTKGILHLVYPEVALVRWVTARVKYIWSSLIVVWMKGTSWSAETTVFVIMCMVSASLSSTCEWHSLLNACLCGILTRQSLLNCPYDYTWRQLWAFMSSYKVQWSRLRDICHKMSNLVIFSLIICLMLKLIIAEKTFNLDITRLSTCIWR